MGEGGLHTDTFWWVAHPLGGRELSILWEIMWGSNGCGVGWGGQ